MVKYKRSEILALLQVILLSRSRNESLYREPASVINLAKKYLNEINKDKEIQQDYHFD